MQPFWNEDEAMLLARLRTQGSGLNAGDIAERQKAYGRNLLNGKPRHTTARLLVRQFTSPILFILLFASVVAFFARDRTDAVIIVSIVMVSSLLGFFQERQAVRAMEKLTGMVKVKSTVLRDGTRQTVPIEELVPGDVIQLAAGDMVAADCRILSADHLHADESALTGESYPASKRPGTVAADAPLAKRENAVFLGSHIVSGSATAVVVLTGRQTALGTLAVHIQQERGETEFERGIRHFGYLLAEVTFVLVIALLAFNVYLQRPVLDSLLFSVALAVGLTPQLLPAVVGVNLAFGAQLLATRKVIVKRLASIENLGGMDLLCTDKTGTLTVGQTRLVAALDEHGEESASVRLLARLNACLQGAYANPIDEALKEVAGPDLSLYRKVAEIPFDFTRKRLSIAVEHHGERFLVTKGALHSVAAVSDLMTDTARRNQALARFKALGEQGYRVLGLAQRPLRPDEAMDVQVEEGLRFVGFLVFADPPKEDAAATVARLRSLGVSLKMVTGDSEAVARHVAAAVGLTIDRVIPGDELQHLSDAALQAAVRHTDVFAEVEPTQKERVVRAARRAGFVVGYLGDGVNDATALHAADVGLSVDSAVDVAKDAADLVLLEKDLGVLCDGVEAGRRTFANTMKYIFMATSANFGNMFSMAGASLFMAFLPLLPKQILLINLLTDLPEMTIASDRVDHAWSATPRRWNIGFIRRFMFAFGLLSSVFDYLTFGVLLWVLNAGQDAFRAGWFLESVVSAACIVLIIRTMGPFHSSRPSLQLALSTLAATAGALAITYTPLGAIFGLKPLPWVFLPVLIAIVMLYALAAELLKRWFYKRISP